MRTKIRSTTDSIELKVVYPVYRTKLIKAKGSEDTFIEKSIIIKELRVKKWFKKDAITSIEDYVTSKNTISKLRSIVFDKYSGRFYPVFHPPEDIMIFTAIPNQFQQQIGFQCH